MVRARTPNPRDSWPPRTDAVRVRLGPGAVPIDPPTPAGPDARPAPPDAPPEESRR